VDEGQFTYIGWSWQNGYWPYRDSWDHKGPLVFVAAFLRTSLFGNGGMALGGQAVLLAISSSVTSACLAARLWNTRVAAFTLVLSTLLWTQSSPTEGVTQIPAVLTSLCGVASVYAAVRAAQATNMRAANMWSLTHGFLAGMTMCIRPAAVVCYGVGVVLTAIIGQTHTFKQRRWSIVISVCGLLLPPVCFILLFASAGVLGDMHEAYFTFNSVRSWALLTGFGIRHWLGHLRMTLQGTGLALPAAIAIAGGAALLARMWRQQRGGLTSRAGIAFFCWLALEIGVLILNSGEPYHVFPLIAPVALSVAWVISELWGRTFHLRFAVLVLVALLTLPPAVRTATLTPPRSALGPRSDDFNRVVADIRSRTKPDDSVFVPGVEGTTLLSTIPRRGPSRYLLFSHLMTKGYGSENRWAEVLAEFERRPPTIVVLDNSGFRGEQSDVRQMLEWAWSRLWLPRPIFDTSIYPSRERLTAFIAKRYRFDHCFGTKCVFSLSALVPPGSGYN